MCHPRAILLTHFLLALAPLGIALVPPHIDFLPVIWGLASVHLAQLMLLSIYLAMFGGKFRSRLTLVTAGILCIGAFQAILAILMAPDAAASQAGIAFLGLVCVSAAVVAVLAAVLALARKGMGQIGRCPEALGHPEAPRPQFSLLFLLTTLSLAALVMGLVRSSRVAGGPDDPAVMIASYLLFAVVFGANIVAAVWAALGAGSVPARLTLVAAVAVILGLALGAAGRMETVDWRLLALSCVMTLAPTAIVVLTLLWLRSSGYRLTERDVVPSGRGAAAHAAAQEVQHVAEESARRQGSDAHSQARRRGF